MSTRLASKHIVNTRAAHQATELDALIRERDGIALAYPCIAIQPPSDPDASAALDSAVGHWAAEGFDWLILTSANTVRALAWRLAALNLSVPTSTKTAVIGPATARAAENMLKLRVDAMPETYIAEALAQALALQPGTRVFLPESAIARPTLPDALRLAGVDLTEVDAYETVRGTGGVALPRLLAQREVDAITFTSSSTVAHFVARLQDEGGDLNLLQEVTLASIGPKTTRTAQEHHLPINVTAPEHTLSGLLDALEAVL